ERRLAQDPVGTLVALGAQFGAERRTRASYRVRATCMEINDRAGSAPPSADLLLSEGSGGRSSPLAIRLSSRRHNGGAAASAEEGGGSSGGGGGRAGWWGGALCVPPPPPR